MIYKIFVCRSCLTTILVEVNSDPWETWEQMQRDMPCCDTPYIRRSLQPMRSVPEVISLEEESDPEPRKDRVELVLEEMEERCDH